MRGEEEEYSLEERTLAHTIEMIHAIKISKSTVAIDRLRSKRAARDNRSI